MLPEDLERIEILSGPAAALYGDGAANGVILVTTKSGGRGPLRASGRATWDASQTSDDFPVNYQRTGVSPSSGQPVSDCSLIAVENRQCTPTGLDVWNPLVQASPFHIATAGSIPRSA
jgi:TonB-dependent SusC/RagA subfamily outer membrane receptor